MLWDMDGTLLDSERLWDVSLAQFAEKLGGVLSPAAREAMVGTSMATSMVILYEDLGVTGRDVDADAAWLDLRTGELFAEGLIWRPGARELLHAVRRTGLRTALVTATSRPLVEQALLSLGAENFDAVVCGGETAAKPDAAPYRLALSLLRVDAGDALVIEDSPTGVASGVAAGCMVLAVPCAAALPEQPGVVIRDTLAGLTVEDLSRIWGRTVVPRS
ncbi:MAG: HAD family phosphatase [Geodermatophilaceae bacterium]|nr:HAD family phosphatase [Geodermatophilaceae bacterium]